MNSSLSCYFPFSAAPQRSSHCAHLGSHTRSYLTLNHPRRTFLKSSPRRSHVPTGKVVQTLTAPDTSVLHIHTAMDTPKCVLSYGPETRKGFCRRAINVSKYSISSASFIFYFLYFVCSREP